VPRWHLIHRGHSYESEWSRKLETLSNCREHRDGLHHSNRPKPYVSEEVPSGLAVKPKALAELKMYIADLKWFADGTVARFPRAGGISRQSVCITAYTLLPAQHNHPDTPDDET